jgi:uncharacterized protein YecT (DUF1311 family)
MKNILIVTFLAMANIVFCQTQSQMNATAAADYRKADKELNAVYQSVLKKHAKEPLFIKAIKSAQKAWIVFRDAEMLAKYPHKDEAMYYGSMFGTLWNSSLEELTVKRTKELKVYLKDLE